jgi:GNAT superfamily N-acetyltransferase
MEATPKILIRSARQADDTFLLEALYHALYVPLGQPPPPRSILEIPRLRGYVSGWSAAREPGIIAEYEDKPIGAAWVRLLAGDERGYGHVADDVPELAFSVLPGFRGQGIGTRMLESLLAATNGRFRAVSLSVHVSNPARHLYERFAFQVVSTVGETVTMCRGQPCAPRSQDAR